MSKPLDPLSEPLYSILPNVDKAIPNALTSQGLTKEGLFSLVFQNFEDLMNTKWWSKFIEKYSMKSPIVEMFGGFNVKFFPELRKLLPGILEGKGKGR